jgi:hypothetical protein
MWPPWEVIGLPLWIATTLFNLLTLAGGSGQTVPPTESPVAVVAPACVQPGARPLIAPAQDAPPCASASEAQAADGGSWP